MSIHTSSRKASVQLSSLHKILSDEEVTLICSQVGHVWRDRTLTPAVTVRSMLYRSLHPDRSIAAVLADMVAQDDGLEEAPSDTAWCKARSRLPEAIWPRLTEVSASRAVAAAGEEDAWAGRPVYATDGTTLSMPDEPALVEAFGYTNTKHGPSRFPVARILLLVRQGAEAVCDWRMDDYRTMEDAQFHALWQTIPDGVIVVYDRHFSTFYNLAKLRQRFIDAVAPLHQRRDPRRLIAQGQRLAKREWRVPLELAPALRKRYKDPTLPEVLWVRLIRVDYRRHGKRKTLWLITTLMDRRVYPAREVERRYRKRWGIETRIGDLKTTLQINVLRGKKPRSVRYEVAATIVAYNLVQAVIHQAARKTRTPADRISFAGAVKTVEAFSARLRYASARQRPRLYAKMLRHVAGHTNRYRPDRIEPRLVKRDPVRYCFLTIPRPQARLVA